MLFYLIAFIGETKMQEITIKVGVLVGADKEPIGVRYLVGTQAYTLEDLCKHLRCVGVKKLVGYFNENGYNPDDNSDECYDI